MFLTNSSSNDSVSSRDEMSSSEEVSDTGVSFVNPKKYLNGVSAQTRQNLDRSMLLLWV